MRTATYLPPHLFVATETDSYGRINVFGGQLSPQLDRRVEQQTEIYEWESHQRADFPHLGTMFDKGNA